VHRSGRTGRANNKGISIVIINMREQSKIHALEKKVGQKFEEALVPNGREICENQLFSLIDKIKDIEVNEEQIKSYLPQILEKFETVSREDLIKKFVFAEFNRFLNYYAGAQDINKQAQKPRQYQSSGEVCTLEINAGRNVKLGVKDLLQFLNSSQKLRGMQVGRISIEKSFTRFEVDKPFARDVKELFASADFGGFQVNCRETDNNNFEERSSQRRGGSGRFNSGKGGRSKNFSRPSSNSNKRNRRRFN
jgi:ATP-dependent RNA helicase DeaD